jgi:hypothetical protein
MPTQWAYRPSEEEHEALLKVMAEHPEFTSVAQVIRESVLRFVHAADKRKMFTEVGALIDALKRDKEEFLNLVLRYSEEEGEL